MIMNQILSVTRALSDLPLLVLVFLISVTTDVSIADEVDVSSSQLYDTNKFTGLMANHAEDIAELEQTFVDHQYSYLPIAPPFSDFVLDQPANAPVIPFSVEGFPSSFNEGLIGYYENSVVVYPVTIMEDASTRYTVFLNEDGQAIYSIAPVSGYDPFAYLKYRFPSLYTGTTHWLTVQEYEDVYDPSRIRMKATLIPDDYLEFYLYAEQQVQAFLPSIGFGGGGMAMMSGGGGSDSNIVFTSIHLATNGLAMCVAYPTNFTNRLDIFSCNYIEKEAWEVAAGQLSTTGTNVITWVETNSWLNVPPFYRNYAAANADIDTDGDGLSDPRENMVHLSDPTNVETDGDGMNDYDEVQQGFNPAVSNLPSRITIHFPVNGRVL